MNSSLPSQDDIATLDYRAQPNASDLILPKTAILSSEERWNDIHFEMQRQPAHDTGQHVHNMHILTMVTSDTDLDQTMDEKSQYGLNSRDKAFILPAGTLHQCKWHQDIEFMFVGLDTNVFLEASRELVHLNNTELVPHFATVEDPLIQGIFLTLKKELLKGVACDYLFIDQLKNTLIAHLLINFGVYKTQVHSYVDGLAKHKLKHILEYIEAHLDEKLTVKVLADQISMSQFYFSRLFRATTNQTPHQYVIQRRIARAKQLLSNSDRPILDISIACGFSNQGHLTKHFKQLVGVTPSIFRKNV